MKRIKVEKMDKATFGLGCFWCSEEIFRRLDGVKSVVSGYTGGKVKNPTYERVCSGETGHAEAIQITFDPKKITYQELLDIFWKSHDPTSLNRQGPDSGTEYRSVIFYHSQDQKKAAEKSKSAIAKEFDKPVVTEIVPLKDFYQAEDHHQNYFNKNPFSPYCLLVIRPKLLKLHLEKKK